MAGQVQQGTSRFSRHLKYSDALSTLKTVLEKNLHILVCWTVQASKQGREDGKKVEERVLPLLLKAASYVGHLAPLDVEACSDVALRWMEVGTDSNWKDNISFTGGISALSELAAHVHTTAARVALRKGTRLTFTPRLLLTCLRMGYLLSLDMQQKEKVWEESCSASSATVPCHVQALLAPYRSLLMMPRMCCRPWMRLTWRCLTLRPMLLQQKATLRLPRARWMCSWPPSPHTRMSIWRLTSAARLLRQ